MRYGIRTIFYVMALLASAIATFGPGGIVLSGYVLLFWVFVFASKDRSQALLFACLALLIGSCCLGLLLPTVQTTRGVSRSSSCANRMKQIAFALLMYHEEHGSFPPAYVTDEEGRPMHSWRVLILPYLEEQGLYDAYVFDEPWDGKNNSKLHSAIPFIFQCLHGDVASHAGNTHHMAVVGPQTAWPGAVGSKLDEFKDGTSETLLLMETSGPGVNWLEPRDIGFDEAVIKLASRPAPGEIGGHRLESFFYHDTIRFHAVMADNSIQTFFDQPSPGVAAALLTKDGGEKFADDDLNRPLAMRVDWTRVYALGVFVILSILPAFWVWRGDRRPTAVEAE